MTIPQGRGSVTCPLSIHTTGPSSWGLQRNTSVLLVGLDQKQVSSQGQRPQLPRGHSKLDDQKLCQWSGQADTTTMKASWVRHLQPQGESLFCRMLGSWERGLRGYREGKAWRWGDRSCSLHLLHPPSLVFPARYSFLFFFLAFPLLSSTFHSFPPLVWLRCSCLDNFLLLLPGKEGTERGWAPGWPGPKEGRLGCYF